MNVREGSERSTEWGNRLTEQSIGAAIAVHRKLGPGLMESTYNACLACEIADRGLQVQRQLELPVVYRGVRLDCGYRIGLLVQDFVIVELKSVEKLLSILEAQLISHLKLSGRKVGLLLNFNVNLLIDGLKRVVNKY